MLWLISINSIQFQLVPWSSSPKSLDSHEQLVWNWDSLLTNDIGILWGGSLFPQAHSLVDLNSFCFLCKSIDTFTNSFYQQFRFAHGYFDSCDFSFVFSFSFSPPSFFFLLPNRIKFYQEVLYFLLLSYMSLFHRGPPSFSTSCCDSSNIHFIDWSRRNEDYFGAHEISS